MSEQSSNQVTNPVSDVAEATVAAVEGSVSTGVESAAPQGAVDAGEVRLSQLEQKYEKDIRALKSSLQRNQSEMERNYKQQLEAANQQVTQLRMATMSDTDKEAFYQQQLAQQLEAERQRSQQLQQQLQTNSQMGQWHNYFIQQGVPADRLDTSNYSALYTSGMAAMTEELSNLRKGGSKKVEKTPPNVTVPSGGAPVIGANWPDLIKKHGSQERVYDLVEQGLLPPDIIPH